MVLVTLPCPLWLVLETNKQKNKQTNPKVWVRPWVRPELVTKDSFLSFGLEISYHLLGNSNQNVSF